MSTGTNSDIELRSKSGRKWSTGNTVGDLLGRKKKPNISDVSFVIPKKRQRQPSPKLTEARRRLLKEFVSFEDSNKPKLIDVRNYLHSLPGEGAVRCPLTLYAKDLPEGVPELVYDWNVSIWAGQLDALNFEKFHEEKGGQLEELVRPELVIERDYNWKRRMVNKKFCVPTPTLTEIAEVLGELGLPVAPFFESEMSCLRTHIGFPATFGGTEVKTIFHFYKLLGKKLQILRGKYP